MESDVHLIFKIEQRLGVVVGPQIDFVANLSTNVQLNALIEIKRGDAALAFRDARIFGIGNVDSEGELGRTLRFDFNLIATEDGFKQLTVYGKLRSKCPFCLVVLGLEFVPVLS